MLRVGYTAGGGAYRRLISSYGSSLFRNGLCCRTATAAFVSNFNSFQNQNHRGSSLLVPEICTSIFSLGNNYHSLNSYCTAASSSGSNVASDCSSENVEVTAVVPPLSKGLADAYSAIELALDSVVKIFTVSSSPNYFLPWQNKSQRETMGSGL